MEKLLHEKLHGLSDPSSAVMVGITEVRFLITEAEVLADEIEFRYAPLPRFEDGEPISEGCEVEGGTVDSWCIWSDGAFSLYDRDGNTIQDCCSGEFVKRPAQKVLDADGSEIKSDDTMFGTGRQQHRYTVQEPYSVNEELGERFCVQCYDHDDGEIVWCDPSMLTHREPDSLRKLRDDIVNRVEDKKCPSYQDAMLREYAARLTALIERGA